MDRQNNWLRLDNAAKIFPSTSSRRNTNVFRFSCELTEPVEQEPLQRALDRTLERFPHFLYILRNGLFWFYLEPGEIRPEVHPESTSLCAQLFYRNQRHLLFDVSFYRQRINFEVYHALADGTGAMQFLTYLVCAYLSETHPDCVRRELADEITPAAVSAQEEDSFKKYYRHVKKDKKDEPHRAYRLHGAYSETYAVTEGILSCKAALALAKSHGASLTIFLCALLVLSIRREMPLNRERRPIVLTVPVNLRQYFPSETARNFFGTIRVPYRYTGGEETLDTVLASLKQSFQEALTPERLRQTISTFMDVERNVFAKIAVLPLKNLVLNAARKISDLGETAVISNVGKISLPEEIVPFVEGISVLSSTPGLQACICTCGDRLSVGFTSRFANTDIQRNFFRMLSEQGLDIEVRSNAAN